MTRMNLPARLAAAALVNIGLLSGAAAEDRIGPRVVGTGENASLEYPTPSANIVGGALTRVTGSGEGASIEVIEVQRTTPGRLSRTSGSGESAQVIYMDQLPPMHIG